MVVAVVDTAEVEEDTNKGIMATMEAATINSVVAEVVVITSSKEATKEEVVTAVAVAEDTSNKEATKVAVVTVVVDSAVTLATEEVVVAVITTVTVVEEVVEDTAIEAVVTLVDIQVVVVLVRTVSDSMVMKHLIQG